MSGDKLIKTRAEALELSFEIQRIAYESALSLMRTRISELPPDTVIDVISALDLQQARQWPPDPRMNGARFDWDKLVKTTWCRTKSMRCAVRVGEQVCALAIGRPSRGDLRLRIQYLQSDPSGNNPLKGHIAALVLTAAELYARAIGKKRVSLENPLAGVKRIYLDFGYEMEPTRLNKVVPIMSRKLVR